MEESKKAEIQADVAPAAAPVQPSQSDHEHELVDTALSAIDTLLNMSMWVIGILAFVLALIGFFGWKVIREACISKAKEMSEKKLDDYLVSEEFSGLLADKVQESIEKKWQGGLFINVDSAKSATLDKNPFPEPKKVTLKASPKTAVKAAKPRKK